MFTKHYRSVKGYSLVLAATVIWSGNFIVARVLSDSVPPVTLVVLRSFIAIIFLAPFVIRPLWGNVAAIRKHIIYIGLTAALGLSMSNTFIYIAAATSPTLNLSLIAICSTVFTIVFARLFLDDVLTFRRIIGLIIATSGVVFLITNGQPSRLANLTFSQGDLWMLGQATSFALYSILVRMKPAELDPLPFLFSLFVLGMLFLIPLFCLELPRTMAIDFSPTILGSIVYLGIGPSLLAYLCWNKSLAIIGPTRAALVYYCLPLFSGLEGLFLLGEPITGVHVLSGTMILAGVIFATWE